MTAGHRHWTLPVGPRMLRALRITVWRCRDVEKVDRSRFPYTGRTPDDIEPDDAGYWRLTLLGFLHGLTGLTVRVEDACPRRQCRGRIPHSTVVHWLGWALR